MKREKRLIAMRSRALPMLRKGLRCSLGQLAIGNGWRVGQIPTPDLFVTEEQFLSAFNPDQRTRWARRVSDHDFERSK